MSLRPNHALQRTRPSTSAIGTSIAANVREASRARSDLEFCSKVEIALQEGDESLLWIELLMEDCGIANEASSWLLREVNELIAIFVTIVSRTKRKMV